VVRRATSGDVEQIVGVFERSFATLDFLPKLHTHAENLSFLAGVVERQDVWVAERDDCVAGFLALDGDLGTFFYVDPEAHEQGVGTALWEEAKRARPRGFSFWAFQRNEKARRFYERRGCIAVEFTDGSGNEERTPDVRYEWRPSPPLGASGSRPAEPPSAGG
jgi:GNAT superfamily N-acetyltransferase